MSVPEAQAAPVLEVGAALGEGPVWDDRDQSLVFVDIVGQRVHRFYPGTGEHSSFPAGAPVGAVALTEDGGILMALHDRFVHVDRAGDHPVPVEGFRADGKVLRFNDGKVDPWGRFLAGTTHHDGSHATGALYMLWPDHTVTMLVDQVTTSNGLAWSANGRTLYYIDTPTHRVDAFDVDPVTGALSGRRAVVEVGDGEPDGMAIDDEGNLWVAIWDGGRVDRYAPNGRLLEVLRVPEGGHVSSVAFGGPSMTTLWVTTARVGLSAAELELNPHAGDVFAYEAPVTGPATFRFSSSPRA